MIIFSKPDMYFILDKVSDNRLFKLVSFKDKLEHQYNVVFYH